MLPFDKLLLEIAAREAALEPSDRVAAGPAVRHNVIKTLFTKISDAYAPSTEFGGVHFPHEMLHIQDPAGSSPRRTCRSSNPTLVCFSKPLHCCHEAR